MANDVGEASGKLQPKKEIKPRITCINNVKRSMENPCIVNSDYEVLKLTPHNSYACIMVLVVPSVGVHPGIRVTISLSMQH